MSKIQENKSQRLKEVLHALFKQPLGQEAINILKERLISSENVFHASTPPESDKFYLGRHSVYKELIRMAENDPNPPKKKETTDE